jgi:hypothetical protein
MKTIWKYQLKDTNQNIEVPKGSKILTAQIQNNEITLWFLIKDSEAEKEKRHFKVYGTGHSIDGVVTDRTHQYINTLQFHGGSLVLHCFEIIE